MAKRERMASALVGLSGDPNPLPELLLSGSTPEDPIPALVDPDEREQFLAEQTTGWYDDRM